MWDFGVEPREARDASSNVTAQYFPLGQTVSGTNYYYTIDQLGSVRDVINSSGTLVEQLTYDPYGRATLLQGSLLSDFQYASYYYHAPSGLNLTLNRALNPNLGRWINRDPIGEEGGVNLYAYVANDAILFVDLAGLWKPTNVNRRNHERSASKRSVSERSCCPDPTPMPPGGPPPCNGGGNGDSGNSALVFSSSPPTEGALPDPGTDLLITGGVSSIIRRGIIFASPYLGRGANWLFRGPLGPSSPYFRKGGSWNNNDYVRIGWGRRIGPSIQDVYRTAGSQKLVPRGSKTL